MDKPHFGRIINGKHKFHQSHAPECMCPLWVLQKRFWPEAKWQTFFPLCPLCCTSQPKSQPSEARAPAAAGPLAPPPPAASRARADTTRGPRWGLSLRRGRLSRARGRTLAAGRGGAGPSAAAGSLARVRARKYARMESPRQHRLISLPRMQDGP